nr:hypothetical protein [Anaerolineae bacterium]
MAEEKKDRRFETIPFFPDHVLTEFYVTLGVLALVVLVAVLGAFMPVGLDDPADPMVTPDHTKPEWYFLFLYQLLKYVPKTLGVLIPIVGFLIIVIWPFIDRRPDQSQRPMRWRIVAVVVFMIGVIVLTILGEVT